MSPSRCQSNCSMSSPPISTTGSSCNSSTNTNVHFNKYKCLKNDLFHDCYKPASGRCSCSELKRSKSVTFCGDTRRGIEDDEECESTASSKASTQKSQKLLKRSNIGGGGVEDRFGNPKVSVGLPEKSFYRQRSVGGVSQSEVRMKFSQKEQAQKENYNRREQGTIERLLQEQRKQEKREKFQREVAGQIKDFENRRTETSVQKSVSVARARQEQSAVNLGRLEAMRVDGEAKEQARIEHLRSEAGRRAQAQANKVEGEIRKEENKIVSLGVGVNI